MDLSQRSAGERDQCDIAASIRIKNQEIFCKVINLSVEGAGMLFESEVDNLPEFFILLLPVVEGCSYEQEVQLRWRKDKQAGVRFAPPPASANVA